MIRLLFCLLVAPQVILGYSLSDWVHIDHSAQPNILNHERPVYLERKGRFIRFDTKDNEVEIELGISIPFIKIPILSEEKGAQEGFPEEHKPDGAVSINAPGVVIAGVLMLTSFILVPLIFPKQPIHNIGRKVDEENSIWRGLRAVDNVLQANSIDAEQCLGKAACWFTKASKHAEEGSLSNIVDSWMGSWWMNLLIQGTSLQTARAIGRSDHACDVTFEHCPITQRHIDKVVAMASGK